MNPPSDPTLDAVSARTFENLAFMLEVSAEEAPRRELSPDRAAASVRFEGPLSGRVVVTVDLEMLPTLASNMLGLDPAALPAVIEQSDALKELANVICGNLLPEIAGANSVFRVRPPVLIDADAASRSPDAPTATASLPLDAGAARVELFIFDGATPVLVTSPDQEAQDEDSQD
jgi:CheY-specific phosphatase CheX